MQASTDKILFMGYLIMLLVAVLVTGCNKSLQPVELVKWIENEENGFRQSPTVGDLNFTLQERPAVYRICVENQGNVNKEDIENIDKEEDPLLHFHFVLKPAKSQTPFLMYQVADEAEYFDRLRYFVSEVEKDIFLVSDSDTLFPVLCHFERNYHVAPYNTLTLAFENVARISNTFRIIYNDRIFNQGPVSFNITKNKRIPKLKPNKV